MNKNVSVWRGFKEPPTNYHVWINEKNEVLLYNGSKWEMILDNISYEDLKQHLATVATSGNYNDLKNKPTIPAAVTESTVSNWGFTKNTGTITGIIMNGVSKGTSGTVDLGTIDTATKITWDASSNMNDFKTPGVYEIYGERTVKTDNLPITNDGSGHSIAARLTVVASTLQPANNEICITQFLQLSNRIGGEGTTYVRTYNENNNGMNGWLPWQKQMGMVETVINNNDATVGQEVFASTAQKIGDGLNGMIDNGMYSGIYTDALQYAESSHNYWLNTTSVTYLETFVLIVINDYAVSGKVGQPRRITQLKYAVDAITGQSTVKKRIGTDNGGISWSDWEDIGGGRGSQEVDITDAIMAYGLPTLVAQGLAKEGVTYKVTCDAGETPVLDVGNKIKNYINTVSSNFDDKVTFKIFTNKIDQYSTFFIDCYIGGATAKYYKFIITDLNNPVERVKISTDMEELPSTINFTFKDNVYTVKRDITWGEAIYKYENIGRLFNIGDGKQILDINNVDLKINDKLVYVWDFIEENGVYVVVHGGSD